ncbi:hypothetical protein UFOVP235_8 [uncultured Caudovirales phage]|uniref:Uncharacterized protein n=1 Tax=uncultured Caudovirales phage TaxID=2100421 RepID=A0A6J7WU36_9CAUD|nr:hypothetical protein UFOVP235_8 [uncultured Caudovirales phage]
MLNTIHPVLVASGNVIKRKDGSTVARPLAISTEGDFCVKVKGDYVAVMPIAANRVDVTTRKVTLARYAKLADIAKPEKQPKAAPKPEAKPVLQPKAARLTKSVKPKASTKSQLSEAGVDATLAKRFGISEAEARQILAILMSAK